jgi:D-lactate dehydrogenase
MLYGKYKILYDKLIDKIDKERIFHDPLHTLAYGTDASFYRLIPKLVIRANDENEVSLILKLCSEHIIPVTFRAAGTSLSGQAISDSVLVIAGSNWKKYSISEDGSEINLQPGITGGRINQLLSRYGRKIGPDLASIKSAMIGGIAANNASGMCCGTSENSYKTVNGIRILFVDGTLLDTRDDSSKDAFQLSHSVLLKEISSLAISARKNTVLAGRIREKYKMKNTTGYSLNALIDFSDPFDIIEHLMIGSEGTLGFIAEIKYRTVIEQPFKASSLMIFPDIETACKAVMILKSSPVSAVELIVRTGLHSVENEKGLPGFLKKLPPGACTLLVETVAAENEMLKNNIDRIKSALTRIPTETEISFTDIPAEYEVLWKIRKGLFPSVGAMRLTGTTVIIEDVAFPVPRLAEATVDLRNLLNKYGYNEAVIFGHALEGNLHFVFAQDFGKQEEVDRYRYLMEEVSGLVVNKYDGSLKAEHGTGRNMAPFVEMEWGHEAYFLMNEIKRIFDPLNILNPGVILNPDKEIHVKNLKPIPAASEIIDKCTECGFCEPSCVSADMTLTPRQRIVIFREMTSLAKSGKEPHILASLTKSFTYDGNETCATDGLCALDCPVKIDTGKLIKNLRSESGQRGALWVANHMRLVTVTARMLLSFVNLCHKILGTYLMKRISHGLRKISGGSIPAWNPYLPKGSRRLKILKVNGSEFRRKVVYFPSCINRSMGVSANYKDEVQLTDKITRLLHKAGYEVIFPENLNNLCCGMSFSSKGYKQAGAKKSEELEAALMKASMNGEIPVLCDMSPCLFTMKENLNPSLKLFEPVEFTLDYIIPYLVITPLNESVTVFPVCSMKKMGLDKKLADLAGICAKEVVVPETNCCGFAGDRGFIVPELNSHGLRNLKNQLPDNVKNGYSNSRTCEIGLSLHTGITYKSIIYLVDNVSEANEKLKDAKITK